MPNHHTHRFWKIKRTIYLNNKRYISPLQRIANKLKIWTCHQWKKIEAFCKAPWIVAAPVVIASREDAIKKATTLDPFLPVTFTDGSV